MIGRLIRRIFVLLILFTVIFLIYRYFNPEGASKFVDNIKSIYEKFIDKDDSVILIDETTNLTGQIELETGVMLDDMGWLEELNKEIEEILSNTKNQNTGDLDEELFYDIDTSTGDGEEMTLNTGENNAVEVINTGDQKNENKASTGDNSSIKWGDCGQGLTQKECDEIKNIFGNLVE